MQFFLDFEKPLVALDQKIRELRDYTTDNVDFSSDIKKLEKKSAKLRDEIFSNLTRWQRTQLARHQVRPYTLDYVQHIFTDWFEVHGDRNFRDDPALVCGFARLDGEPCAIIGHQKGRDTKEKVYRNFGMPNPEGYRKALRVMKMAEQFGLPIFTFVDTPGAFPGIGAEERGQAEAIARSTEACLELGVPMIAAIVGEGGSGGAVALAAANRILMFEHAVYSVISPEGCASILWRTSEKAADAAEAMRITAQQLEQLGIVDEVVREPLGGGHRSPAMAISALSQAIEKSLDMLGGQTSHDLRQGRREKFLAMGVL